MNGFLDNAPLTLALVRELGLEPELEPSSGAARKRFLYRDGRLHPLPTSPLAFFTSSVLSPAGRLRVALEPFAPKAPPGDETIHHFAARRIGDEAARTLVDAMVSGIFAGDSRNLSVASCLRCSGNWKRTMAGSCAGCWRKCGPPAASDRRAATHPPGRMPARAAI